MLRNKYKNISKIYLVIQYLEVISKSQRIIHVQLNTIE